MPEEHGLIAAEISSVDEVNEPCRRAACVDRVQQDAGHAWAEVHVERLGWVGFDISNAISPDSRYVRVATGLDYREAAPVSGMRFGAANESLDVSIQVQQQ